MTAQLVKPGFSFTVILAKISVQVIISRIPPLILVNNVIAIVKNASVELLINAQNVSPLNTLTGTPILVMIPVLRDTSKTPRQLLLTRVILVQIIARLVRQQLVSAMLVLAFITFREEIPV